MRRGGLSELEGTFANSHKNSIMNNTPRDVMAWSSSEDAANKNSPACQEASSIQSVNYFNIFAQEIDTASESRQLQSEAKQWLVRSLSNELPNTFQGGYPKRNHAETTTA